MHTLSEKHLKFVSAGYFGFVYVTPEWKQAEAEFSGQVWGIVGVSIGAAAFALNPTAPTLLAPLVLGAVGYATGYAVSTMANFGLENHSLYFFY